MLLDTLLHIIRAPVFGILTEDCSSEDESLEKPKYNTEEENRTRTLEEIRAFGA